MANYKRKKSHRVVRCSLCNPYSWMGNNKGRKRISFEKATQERIKDIVGDSYNRQ